MKKELIRRMRLSVGDEVYNLRIYDTFTRGEFNKPVLAYRFADSKGVIFEGADFECSMVHSTDSRHTALELLSFLTLREGDTGKDYFENYTERQWAFSRSYDCEILQSRLMEEI